MHCRVFRETALTYFLYYLLSSFSSQNLKLLAEGENAKGFVEENIKNLECGGKAHKTTRILPFWATTTAGERKCTTQGERNKGDQRAGPYTGQEKMLWYSSHPHHSAANWQVSNKSWLSLLLQCTFYFIVPRIWLKYKKNICSWHSGEQRWS